jgi:hypothetical protein
MGKARGGTAAGNRASRTSTVNLSPQRRVELESEIIECLRVEWSNVAPGAEAQMAARWQAKAEFLRQVADQVERENMLEHHAALFRRQRRCMA